MLHQLMSILEVVQSPQSQVIFPHPLKPPQDGAISVILMTSQHRLPHMVNLPLQPVHTRIKMAIICLTRIIRPYRIIVLQLSNFPIIHMETMEMVPPH